MLTELVNGYHRVMADGDHRTNEWPLMSSPVLTHAIVGMYLLFVYKIGPSLMANRPAYDLRHLIMVYNAGLVYLSWYTFWNVGWSGWWTYYDWKCQLVDTTTRGDPMARLTWLFFVSKLVELLDTVFFVLRKKTRQITPLHMIHHTGMPLCMWWAAKFAPGGHGSIIGLINSFVHVVMYSYYFLAAFGPAIEPYLWWKKYITQLQLIQFAFIFGHTTQAMMRSDCDYPRPFMWLLEVPSVMFIFMFGQFYIRTYRRDARKERELRQLKKSDQLGG